MIRSILQRSAVIALLVAAPATASADEDTQTRANELFSRGQVRYEAGDFRQAISLFDEAYQLVRDPVYLFNIAQAYRKVFDCVPAVKYFERYLAEATDADGTQRAKVKELISELGPCVADRAGKPALIGGAAIVAPPATKPAAPVVVVEDSGRGMRLGGLALVGAGAIGLAVGTIYSARGSSIESDLAACARGCQWTPEREALDNDGKRANTISAVSWIAGGVAVAGGAVLYILGRSKRTERLAVAPAVTSSSAAVMARFRF